MMPRLCAREDDEKHLMWLHLRGNGWSVAQIASRFGAPYQTVKNTTDRILDADIAESGKKGVREAYW